MIQPQIPTLDIQPLNKKVFAPFGTVIETDGAKQISINQGTTTRFDAISAVDACVLISLSVVECHQPNIDVAFPK